MRVLLVDADSVFPNLALMKIAAHNKTLGHEVDLIRGIPTTAPLHHYDTVYISCLFYQNQERVLDYAEQFTDTQCHIGGTGVDLHHDLPDNIEHIMPDYDLYDIDYSIGFTSRGCIRNCGFCVVPSKEGTIRDNAFVSEFLHPDHVKIILLDNNFLASPRWRDNLLFISMNGIKVNFNQGLDIRLITKDNAQLLYNTLVYDHKFKKRSLYFAFDDIKYEKAVRTGIEILFETGFKPTNLMFYVLVGYDTQYEQDIQRFDILREYDVRPFIMPYNQTQDKRLRHLTRWVNRKYYEFVPRSEYLGGVLK